MMKYSIATSKAILVLFIFLITSNNNNNGAKAQEEEAGEGSNYQSCINLLTTPTPRYVFDYTNTYQFSASAPYTSDIVHYLLNSHGSQIFASNANSSRVCYPASSEDEDCHYLFLTGNGYFEITTDNNDDDVDNNTVAQGDLVYGSPQLIRMGNNCRHYCGDDESQLVFVGETGDKPALYDRSETKEAIKEVEFDETVMKEPLDMMEYMVVTEGTENEEATTTTTNNETSSSSSSSSSVVEYESLIMQTTCLKPTSCYELVGSAVYMITNSNNRNNNNSDIIIMEQEGTTYDGFKTFGSTASSCYNRCDEKPLLVETQRGQDIALVLSTISGMSVLADVNSPQYSAACWLIHDDARQLNASDRNVIQRYVLALLYYTLGGSRWMINFDFLTEKDECAWSKSVIDTFYDGIFFEGGSGVQCNDDGDVSAIILTENNLDGTIPSEISWLVQTEYLDFSQNLVQGTLPPQIGQLRNLMQIRTYANQLTGSIPPTLGEIESLEVLDLGSNEFEGNMISVAGGNLVILDLMFNYLTGQIPTDIGIHTSLVYFSLFQNMLSGTIPESISNLSAVEFVVFEGNNIGGTLPSQIFTLPNLYYLWLSGLSISGTIPNNVTSENWLNLLYLDGNQLTGTIPSELSLFGGLEWVWLQNNVLTGQIPSDFGQLGLLDFRIQNNYITGDVPFEDCESFIFLESDCDSPQLVTCDCCTRCHGIFTAGDDMGRELECPSRQLTILFEGLQSGDFVSFQVQTADGESSDYNIAAEETSHTHTECISTSSCFTVNFPENFTAYPFDMILSVNDDVVLEEFVTDPQSSYNFGYSLEGRNFQKDTCDSFELCNSTAEPDTPKRELINTLTRFTGTDVFEDVTSPYYNAACEWVDYLDGKRDEELRLSATLQYFFLSLFYFVTNGEEWINSDSWVESDAYCSWYGISCDEHDIVTEMNLGSNNLVGSVPTEIGELRGLERVVFSQNYLSGTIPLEMGVKLPRLRHFNVSTNLLMGRLPSEMGLLTDLVEIDVSINQLADLIPSEVGQLENIQIFNLFGNTFAGELPTEFFRLTGMKLLSVGSNLLRGDASEVKTFLDLETLDLSDNFFTGTIPVGTFQGKLRSLYLSGNQFTGSISSSVEQLQSLEEFFIFNNLLTGNLPSQVGNLEQLKHVSLSYNRIKGLIPSEIGNLRNLTVLHLHNNDLEGHGDFFQHVIDDYIADCGNTITSPARVLCDNCTSCCNVDGDCLKKNITWPSSIMPPQVPPITFVFLITLAGAAFLVMALFVLHRVFEVEARFGFAEEFQTNSIYKFFLCEKYSAKALAAATVALQTLLLYIFIAASDFTGERNDWEYSMSCPDNSILCEDRRHVTGLAWFAFSCVLFSFLFKDLIQSYKMISESVRIESWTGVFAGFTVFFITALSIVASTLYNYSTGISNTDILKDAVILLFLNDIDEQLYTLICSMYPLWVEKRNHVIKLYLQRQIHQTQQKQESRRFRRAISDEELRQKAKQFFRLVEVGDHRYLLTKYKNCFVGSEAVDVMVDNEMARSREEAITLGNLMMEKLELFYHVTGDHGFKDENLFYYFSKSQSVGTSIVVHDFSTSHYFDEEGQSRMLEAAIANGEGYASNAAFEPLNEVMEESGDGIVREEMSQFFHTRDFRVELQKELTKLKNDQSAMKEAYEKQIGEYKMEMSDLKHDYSKLENDHTKLQNDYTKLKDEINDIKKILQSNDLK